MSDAGILDIRDLKVFFTKRTGLLKRIAYHIKAVNNVSLSIPRGSTFGLVGESGCGKSSLGKACVGLAPVSSGDILYNGESFLPLIKSDRRQAARRIQMIFQDPYGSLNPRLKIGPAIDEAVSVSHPDFSPADRRDKTVQFLKRVGLNESDYDKYPHEFSGGQRQRICIARALAVEPEFIICDESVSALDVSIQASVLNLLKDLQAEFDLTYLFISHDLSVVRFISDQIGVMYLGELVETASAEAIFSDPQHPYTKSLLTSIPNPDPDSHNLDKDILEGDVPSPINLPTGCFFIDRCPYKSDACLKHPVFKGDEAHRVRCVL